MTPTFRVSHLAHVRACCGILLEDRFAYGSYRRVSIGALRGSNSRHAGFNPEPPGPMGTPCSIRERQSVSARGEGVTLSYAAGERDRKMLDAADEIVAVCLAASIASGRPPASPLSNWTSTCHRVAAATSASRRRAR